jgi:hypothetical protein
MAHFAKLDENNIVLEVNVVHNDVIDNLPFPESEPLGIQFLTEWSNGYSNWKQCSYNTYENIHVFGGVPIRKNYPGKGFIYDPDRDAFYSPKPFPSFVLNETTCVWQTPIPCPSDDKIYLWDEPTTAWVEVPPENLIYE